MKVLCNNNNNNNRMMLYSLRFQPKTMMMTMRRTVATTTTLFFPRELEAPLQLPVPLLQQATTTTTGQKQHFRSSTAAMAGAVSLLASPRIAQQLHREHKQQHNSRKWLSTIVETNKEQAAAVVVDDTQIRLEHTATSEEASGDPTTATTTTMAITAVPSESSANDDDDDDDDVTDKEAATTDNNTLAADTARFFCCFTHYDLDGLMEGTEDAYNDELGLGFTAKLDVEAIKQQAAEQFGSAASLQYYNGIGEWKLLLNVDSHDFQALLQSGRPIPVRVPEVYNEFDDAGTPQMERTITVLAANLVGAGFVRCSSNSIRHKTLTDNKIVMTKDWILQHAAAGDKELRDMLLSNTFALEHIAECLHFDFFWKDVVVETSSDDDSSSSSIPSTQLATNETYYCRGISAATSAYS
jgi:hypothetical protein